MTFEFDKTDLSFLLLLIPLRYPINDFILLLSNIKCPESIRPILDPRPISLPETISSIRSVLKPDKIVEEDGREEERRGEELN